MRPAPCCARNAASAFMDLAFFADFCANALASAAGRSDTRVPLIMRVGKIIRGIRAAPARSTAAFRNAPILPRRRKWPCEVGAGLSSRPGGPNLPIRGLDSRAEKRSAARAEIGSAVVGGTAVGAGVDAGCEDRKQSKMPGIIEEALVAYTYVGTWIVMSAGVILYNKYILTVFGFPFPVTLTMIHMAFCSALAFVLVRVLGVVKGINMSRETYVQKIVPIAGLFAVVLWMGNSAYVYLSVAFIQMVKALMPCVVYTVGCVFKVEKYKRETMMNMLVIALGVAIASYGELNFNLTGFMLLIGSIACEAVRIVSIQMLLTSADIKLNSVTTLYYVSPACFVFLLAPFVFIEAPRFASGAEDVNLDPMVLGSNAMLAFGLNMAVYLLIGKTSALTMNVAGVIKDWMLIFISSVMFDAPISTLQLWGYLLAFLAVCYYNYQKYQERVAAEAAKGAGGKAVKLDDREAAGGGIEMTKQITVNGNAVPSSKQ